MKAHGEREYLAVIGGEEYGMDRLEEARLSQELFTTPSVGGTACAQLTMTFRPGEAPPRMGRVQAYARDAGQTAWTPLGIFWIDRRTEREGRLEIECYDVMLAGEAEWQPEQTLVFPMSMEAAARAIAAAMGTELDQRCAFHAGYTVDYPANGYTMRQVLGYIGAAHGGNWFATAEGKLLLAPLYGSAPPETHYLIDEDGQAITFGGVRILI